MALDRAWNAFQGGYVDSVKGWMLNEKFFLSLAHAQVEIVFWAEHWNR